MAELINVRELELELSKCLRTVDEFNAAVVSDARDGKDRHARSLRDQEAQAHSLDARYKRGAALALDVKARLLEEREAEAAVQSSFTDLSAQGAALQQQVASLLDDLGAEHQRVERHKDDLRVESSVQQKRLDALRRAVRLFSDRLGLEFRHGADELQLVFSQVDPQQPDRPFVLSIRILPDNTYEVTRATPAADGLPSLVALLNSSNDFSAFVKAVRKAFVRSAAA